MKKLFHVLIFNFALFLLLIIGIQNSDERSKVRFLEKTTIDLPISFIFGSSFIVGSIFGSLSPIFFKKLKSENL